MLNLEEFVLEEQKGKIQVDPNSKNRVKWAVEEPEDNDAADDIDLDSEENTESLEDLIVKFETEKPFFIQGEAGWGKTSIIKKLAKKFDKEVVTVYLDKAEAVDLGGIPVPVKGEYKVKGNAKDVKEGDKKEYVATVNSMPKWAKKMLDNPDTDYLLFFDEMNQAQPDVMNALMPIVQEQVICEIKFDNFFVGAAGNFESENKAVNELSGPLASRFKPLIIWETGTKKSWAQVFTYLHKKWDKVLGENIVKAFEDSATCFENPREIEEKIFEVIYRLKVKGVKRNKSSFFLRMLNGLKKEGLKRSEEQGLEKLAETCYNYVQGIETDNKNSRRGGKDGNAVPESIQKMIKSSMKDGFFTLDIEDEKGNVKKVKFGACKETLQEYIDSEECNAEMYERTVRKYLAEGITWKYDKPQDWKKLKLEDPEDDKWSFVFPCNKKTDVVDNPHARIRD